MAGPDPLCCAYAYNPDGAWTSRHQMSLGGKRDGFSREDLIAFARSAGIKKARATRLLQQVGAAVKNWRSHAERAEVFERDIERIEKTLRTELIP